MQLLPGEALRAFLDLHPAPLATAGHAVRRLIRGYDDACAALTDPGVWSGPAGSSYDEARTALLRHLDEGPESLVGRLESTAGYADALADWVEGSRWAVARVLAEVLGSTEAVRVRAATAPGAGPAVGSGAAAEIATRVLSVLGVAYDGAETLLASGRRAWPSRPGGRPAGRRTTADPCGSADRDRVCSPAGCPPSVPGRVPSIRRRLMAWA